MLPGGVRRQWGGAVERILGHGQQRSSEILFVALQSSVAIATSSKSKSLRRALEPPRERGARGRGPGAGDRAEVRMLLY